MNNLEITISGKAKSGKSRLTYFLKKYLQEQGFNVEFKGNLDHPTQNNFDRYMSQNIDNIIKNIKKNRKIILKEKQLPLNYKK